jgi:hypothetical protein
VASPLRLLDRDGDTGGIQDLCNVGAIGESLSRLLREIVDFGGDRNISRVRTFVVDGLADMDSASLAQASFDPLGRRHAALLCGLVFA